MTIPKITWGTLRRFFKGKEGFYIYKEGGDAYIAKEASEGKKKGKRTVGIGHNFLKHTSIIPPGILKNIERKFGITREDILND